jgi:probable HAF family extracellular repeat protein
MKSKFRMLLAAITFFAGLALLFAALALPLRLAAQEKQDRNNGNQHHHYQLIDMGTFGGPNSSYPSLNRPGVVVGWSATSNPKLPHSHPLICGGLDGVGSFITVAFQWKNGSLTDLGALPGDSNCSEPFSLNSHGDSVGVSENGEFDPQTGVNQARAVRWKDGEIEDLGSFGGNQNAALFINNRGQIVGNSLNTIPDPFSFFDFFFFGSQQGTQTRAFLWEHGQMQDLGTLGTGNDASAGFINERGQVVGFSYTNSTPNPTTGLPTVDPFFWENGNMTDLGTLGGTFGMPNALNNHGQVVGFSNLPGDQSSDPFLWDNGKLIDLNTTTIGGNPLGAFEINDAGEIIGAAAFPNAPYDAYVWRNGVATDLGHLDGDCYSEAWAINSKGQVVGNSFSCVPANHHAFLWENGSIVDLNTLIPPGSSLQLVLIGPFSSAPAPGPINDRGEIGGTGVPPGCSPQDIGTCGHAFLLIPCDENHPNIEGCDYSLVEAPAAVPQPIPAIRDASSRTLPQSLLRRMSRMSQYRFPGLPMGPRN